MYLLHQLSSSFIHHIHN